MSGSPHDGRSHRGSGSVAGQVCRDGEWWWSTVSNDSSTTLAVPSSTVFLVQVASDRYADSWLQYLVNSSFAGFICALGKSLRIDLSCIKKTRVMNRADKMKSSLLLYMCSLWENTKNGETDSSFWQIEWWIRIFSFAGINFTGLYGNPIVASACTFNCLGVSHLGHLAVYWASPIIAWWAWDGLR